MSSVRDMEARVGGRVRALREQHAMTQAEFADVLRPHGLRWYPTIVSTVENGRRPLRFTEALVICDALDTELMQLAP